MNEVEMSFGRRKVVKISGYTRYVALPPDWVRARIGEGGDVEITLQVDRSLRIEHGRLVDEGNHFKKKNLSYFAFIWVPIPLTFKKTKRPEKEIITPLKPDLLRSIFFLIYTSIGWTLFTYLLEMDNEFAGIAAIIAGLIVAGFDPNETIAITRRNIA